MLRRQFIARSLISAAGVLSGSSCVSGPAGELRVSSFPRIAMSGLYLAQELGYFKEEGLEVRIQEITNGAHSLALLVGDQLDVRFSSLNSGFIHSVARGADVRVVAGREIASRSCGTAGTIYGNADVFPQGLRDLSQLRGKRVSIAYETSLNEFYLDTLLATAGMSSDDVELIILGKSEAAAALVAGKIDALVSSHFEKGADVRLDKVVKGIGLSDLFPDYQYSFIFFGPSLVRSDGDRGARFLAAYLRGAKAFLNGQTPQYLYRLARAARMDPDIVAGECRDTFVQDGRIDLESIEMFVDWAVGKGYCEEHVSAEWLVDERFIDRAGEILAAREAGRG
jgi:ABC-type nitrate/sulfonate/bicarbonate transport system substrate-binding protein